MFSHYFSAWKVIDTFVCVEISSVNFKLASRLCW